MESVRVEMEIKAPIDEVWKLVEDVERYPDYMESVRSVSVKDEQLPSHRLIAWSVLLKGSVLEWVEEETILPNQYRIEFTQVDGDLEKFEGYWQLTAARGFTQVELRVDFEIGIPLLAEMLNPVAARALVDNSRSMLSALQERSRSV